MSRTSQKFSSANFSTFKVYFPILCRTQNICQPLIRNSNSITNCQSLPYCECIVNIYVSSTKLDSVQHYSELMTHQYLSSTSKHSLLEKIGMCSITMLLTSMYVHNTAVCLCYVSVYCRVSILVQMNKF